MILLLVASGYSLFAQAPIVKPYTGYGLDRRFPGGEIALAKFLRANIKYPHSAYVNGIQGKVMIKLKILPDGTVDSVHAVTHLNKYLEDEAVRVSKLLNFEPTRDTLSNLYFILPIGFKLN